MIKKIPKIGAHVSASGGFHKAIENAQRIGAECIQIFGASPQQWNAKIPSESDAKLFKDAAEKAGVGPVFLHAAYLVNLASRENSLYEKSIKSLSEHLQIASLLGAQGLIFHMGSAKDTPREHAIKKTVEGMKNVLKNVPGEVQLIMENSAGGGQKLGASPEEMAQFYVSVSSTRVKLCIDTAHIFEAGIIEKFTPPLIKKLLDEWDNAVGLENIVALHVNDSKTPPNSHHDRHENIGEGYIGLSGFKNLAQEKRLHNKAWILEVPGFDGVGPDKRNVEILKGCFARS